jgi:hypothetical protein
MRVDVQIGLRSSFQVLGLLRSYLNSDLAPQLHGATQDV